MDLPNLEKHELEWCREAALEEYRRMGDGKQTISYYTGKGLLDVREKAKIAEFSAAKFLGFERPNSVDEWSGPDIGHWIQVRWNSRGVDLLHPLRNGMFDPKKRDPRSYAYCLVLGDGIKFKLSGWIGGDILFRREPIVYRKGDAPTYKVTPEELSQDFEHLKLIAKSSHSDSW